MFDNLFDDIREFASTMQEAVVGVPDRTRGNIVKAVVVPAESDFDEATLREELQSFAHSGLSKHECPREIAFVEELPKTAFGKNQAVDG